MYAHIYLAGALMAGLEKRCPGLDLEVDRMGTHCHVGHVDSVVESEECCAPRMKPNWMQVRIASCTIPAVVAHLG